MRQFETPSGFESGRVFSVHTWIRTCCFSVFSSTGKGKQYFHDCFRLGCKLHWPLVLGVRPVKCTVRLTYCFRLWCKLHRPPVLGVRPVKCTVRLTDCFRLGYYTTQNKVRPNYVSVVLQPKPQRLKSLIVCFTLHCGFNLHYRLFRLKNLPCMKECNLAKKHLCTHSLVGKTPCCSVRGGIETRFEFESG